MNSKRNLMKIFGRFLQQKSDNQFTLQHIKSTTISEFYCSSVYWSGSYSWNFDAALALPRIGAKPRPKKVKGKRHPKLTIPTTFMRHL